MELRQTIRTGIRNIRRAWWEPGLMLALSALLVAAAWLWIPAPLVENPVQTELLYIQVDSGTHGMVRWKPKTMVERQTARAIVDHMATLHKKNTLCPAQYVHPLSDGGQLPGGGAPGGRRPAQGGQLSPGWRRPGPGGAGAPAPGPGGIRSGADPWGAVRREPVNGADQLGKAGECWYLLTDVGKIGMLRA